LEIDPLGLVGTIRPRGRGLPLAGLDEEEHGVVCLVLDGDVLRLVHDTFSFGTARERAWIAR
jgi:hypothetical protein